MSRRGIRSSCVRKISLGLAEGRDWSPEVLIRDTGPRQSLLGPSLPAQPGRGKYHWGPCQVWEAGQWLAPSQPQMLAGVAVPGAALSEDPLGGAGGDCWACLLSPHRCAGSPGFSTVPASSHQDPWEVGAVIVPICQMRRLRPREVKSRAQSDPVHKRRL